VGKAIGNLVGCEMALVTSGCAGAMTLASAAAMAGDDPHKIIQLPDTTGKFTRSQPLRLFIDHFLRRDCL
jgi:hypothetical protein